jgi:hypothetical protein
MANGQMLISKVQDPVVLLQDVEEIWRISS